jgi:hypothetical protein
MAQPTPDWISFEADKTEGLACRAHGVDMAWT